MNEHSLNGAALNAGPLDVYVRTFVDSRGYAISSVKARVLAYLRVSSTPKVVTSGSLGFVREPGYTRTPVDAVASAITSLTTRVMHRSPVSSVAAAVSSLTGRINETQRYAPVSGLVRAVSAVLAMVMSREPVSSRARAITVIAPRVHQRVPVSGHGQAVSTIDFEVVKLAVFDKLAPPEDTFVVPFDCNQFTVGDQMLLAKIAKQPRDVRDYDIDFGSAEWGFPATDVISSVQCTVEPSGLTATYAYSGLVAKIWAQGGTNKVNYKVTVLATTNNGRAKEVELIFKVKDE